MNNNTTWNHNRDRVRYSIGPDWYAVALSDSLFYAAVPRKAGAKIPPSLRGRFKSVEALRSAVETHVGRDKGYDRKSLERDGYLYPAEPIPPGELKAAQDAAHASASGDQ